MLESTPTYGSITSSDDTKRDLARKSLSFNVQNQIFVKLFPHYKEKYDQLILE